MRLNKYIYSLGLLFFVVVGGLVAQYLILGGAREVKLSSSAPLTGSVAQSLYSGNGRTKLLTPGKDFNLKNTHYFDNNTWVVTTVTPTKQQFNQAVVVLEKKDSAYQAVLGPGSAFSSSVLISLPTDVANYLSNLGVTYGLGQ